MLAGDVLSYNVFGRALEAIEEEGHPGQRGGDDDDDEVDNAEESDTVVELGSRAGTYLLPFNPLSVLISKKRIRRTFAH